jgi:urease accessory protein
MLRSLVLVACLLALPHPAAAHVTGVASGFGAGFLHPLLGPDHLVAMVAVGLWGAQLGAPAIWVLPVAFPLVMAAGGMIGVSGAELPYPEQMIALSGLALGLMVAFRVRIAFWAAAAVVAVFALFHGYSHGREMPQAADAASFAIGFVVATGLLHLLGIGVGAADRSAAGKLAIRGLGAAIAAVGCFFVASTFGIAA